MNRKSFFPLLLALAAVFLFSSPPFVMAAQKTEPQNIPISFGYWDIDSTANAPAPDGLTAFLEERFSFKARPHSFNWSTYKQQYRILAATDDLPDVFSTNLLSSNDADDTAFFHELIESGDIRPLPADLSPYPCLEALLSHFESHRQKDGLFYCIPRPNFLDTTLSSSDAALVVRRDWMEKLGIEDPENLEDFIKMASAFASQDPDGNQIDDTFGYNANSLSALGKWVILGIAPQCNVYCWTQNQDGSYLPSWLTQDFEQVVLAYRRLYETGGLDPNFYVKNASAVVDDFVSGRLGAMEYKFSASALSQLQDLWEAENDLPFDKCVDVLPIFPAPDGLRYSNSSNLFWSETYISSSISEEAFGRLLSLFDFLLSKEGMTILKLGFQGSDFDYAKDGSLISLLDTKTQTYYNALRKKYPSLNLWSNIVSWGWERSDFEAGPESSFLYSDSCIRLAQKALSFCERETLQIQRPYAFLTYPKEHSTFHASAFHAFIHSIIGKGDPLKLWRASLEKMKENGLEDYVRRQNQLYQSAKP